MAVNDPSIATITRLTFVPATDKDGNEIGRYL
jgi:hypothetical protein